MSLDEARVIIESCAEMYGEGVPPPVDGSKRPGPEGEALRARRLARLIIEDIKLYHGEALEGGVDARIALAAEIQEGRELFKQRVQPQHYPLFEGALAHLDMRAQGGSHEVWLTDEGSVRSVSRRWAAELRRVPSEERDSWKSKGARWVKAWTLRDQLFEIWTTVMKERGLE